MSFKRQPLLTFAEENKLAAKMEPLWNEENSSPKRRAKYNYTSTQIAIALGFGIPGIYAKLKPWYVAFYRTKFNDDPRYPDWNGHFQPRSTGGCKKGHSRYKVNPKQLHLLALTEPAFEKRLNEKLPLGQHPDIFRRKHRAYIICHYFTPLRKSELYERTISDFEIQPKFIQIHLQRKKKKYKNPEDEEPLKIRRSLPIIEELVTYLLKVMNEGNPNKKPLDMDSKTAWLLIHQVFGDMFPHAFRFRYIVKGLSNPAVSMVEMKTKTGLNIVTINNYAIASEESEDSLDDKMEQTINEERAATTP